jgi:Family of unknown function (DUF6152)
MRAPRMSVAGAFAAFFLAGGIVSAHHSQAGYLPDDQIRTMKGVVAEYKWRNPHVFVVWDVKDDSGNVVQWVGEMPSVTSVIAQGMSKNSLKQGDEIVVTGQPSRVGTECLIRTIKKADGTLVYPLKENGPREGTQ